MRSRCRSRRDLGGARVFGRRPAGRFGESRRRDIGIVDRLEHPRVGRRACGMGLVVGMFGCRWLGWWVGSLSLSRRQGFGKAVRCLMISAVVEMRLVNLEMWLFAGELWALVGSWCLSWELAGWA